MKCRKKIRKEFLLKSHQGSFTVEAALVLPMCLGVIIMLIYMCTYIHDKAVMEYEAYKACILADEVEFNKASEEYSEHTIGKWTTRIDIERKEDRNSVEINGNMMNSQGILRAILEDRLFMLKVKCNKEIIDDYTWIMENRT